MRLLIDISEEFYEKAKMMDPKRCDQVWGAIANGQVLTVSSERERLVDIMRIPDLDVIKQRRRFLPFPKLRPESGGLKWCEMDEMLWE